MRLADFDFPLPPELIAQEPVEPRDSARLLVFNRTNHSIEHHRVADLPSLLPPHTLLVRNNSKVRHGRLFTTEGREILIVKKVGELYSAMIRGKQPKIGQIFSITESFTATVKEIEEGPGMTTVLLELHGEEEPEILLQKHGKVPLPPYIHDSHAPADRYQTIYADPLGSAAAPTAGLHFTPQLFDRLTAAQHKLETVTLHVGLGTFLPLRNEDVTTNHLHGEETLITEKTAHVLTNTLQNSQPLLAVGTTSLRTLESHWNNGAIQPGTMQTELFLYPGKPIHTANVLFTNFHLPKSSLLLLVAAFLDMDANRNQQHQNPEKIVAILQSIYATAIAEKYRFFSFGDAMLIL